MDTLMFVIESARREFVAQLPYILSSFDKVV